MFGVLTSLLCGLTRTALPSAPQHLTASDTGATYVVLRWLPPEDTGLGGRYLSYKVFYQDVNGTSLNMTTNITYHNVTGLSPNTIYTMTVMADNGIAGNEENRRVSVITITGTVYYVNVVMCIAVQCIVQYITVQYNHCYCTVHCTAI